jgi:hypothetical protein
LRALSNNLGRDRCNFAVRDRHIGPMLTMAIDDRPAAYHQIKPRITHEVFLCALCVLCG